MIRKRLKNAKQKQEASTSRLRFLLLLWKLLFIVVGKNVFTAEQIVAGDKFFSLWSKSLRSKKHNGCGAKHSGANCCGEYFSRCGVNRCEAKNIMAAEQSIVEQTVAEQIIFWLLSKKHCVVAGKSALLLQKRLLVHLLLTYYTTIRNKFQQ